MHCSNSTNLLVQQATHPRLHLRDVRDAHIVFEAVRQGFLLPVTRRLNTSERATYIRSGAVFVWEEQDDDSGLKRWTDGRLWGQSRMREPYLFYDEKLTSTANASTPKSSTFRFVEGVTRSVPLSSALLHQDRSGGTHRGLIKQAYSAWVHLSPTSAPRKWHITAYFSYADLANIPTVDHDIVLSRVVLPSGIYRSSKNRKGEELESHSSSPATSMLPSLHVAIGGYSTLSMDIPPKHPGPSRLSEDQRLIQILNSRYIP